MNSVAGGEGEVSWAVVPEGMLLGIRRAFKGGGREQWVIVRDGSRVRLRKSDDDDWADVAVYPDIPSVFGGQPELARQRPGRVTYFDLSSDAGIDDEALVALLDPCAEEGGDAPAWAENADCWEDWQIWEWAEGLDFFRRLVCITDPERNWYDRQVSWLDNNGLLPVLADEDGFIGDQIASFTLTFTGYSMVGYTGGAKLILLAPGLAISVPTGEAHEVGEWPPFLVDYPDEGSTRERALAIANWLTEAESRTDGPAHLDVHAALQFEPFDPNGTLDNGGQNELSIAIEFDCSIDIPSDVTDDFRHVMAVPGSEYSYIKEALADPCGRAARALADADGGTFWEGCWYKALLEEDGLG